MITEEAENNSMIRAMISRLFSRTAVQQRTIFKKASRVQRRATVTGKSFGLENSSSSKRLAHTRTTVMVTKQTIVLMMPGMNSR